MTYTPHFGMEEGLGKRMASWANQLAMDRRYPWAGSGLIDDLICAARVLGENPAALFPALAGLDDPREEPAEYDL